jgi:hypothetical protein
LFDRPCANPDVITLRSASARPSSANALTTFLMAELIPSRAPHETPNNIGTRAAVDQKLSLAFCHSPCKWMFGECVGVKYVCGFAQKQSKLDCFCLLQNAAVEKTVEMKDEM